MVLFTLGFSKYWHKYDFNVAVKWFFNWCFSCKRCIKMRSNIREKQKRSSCFGNSIMSHLVACQSKHNSTEMHADNNQLDLRFFTPHSFEIQCIATRFDEFGQQAHVPMFDDNAKWFDRHKKRRTTHSIRWEPKWERQSQPIENVIPSTFTWNMYCGLERHCLNPKLKTTRATIR